MDIRKWLDETVLPEQPPSPPDQRSLPPLFQSREIEQTHREKRWWKRRKSDSSLLDTRSQCKKTPPIEDAADVEENARSEAPHPVSQSTGSSKSSHKYARRPRHKTRPERYEAAAKAVEEGGTHTHRRRKGESNRTKRKPKPSKAGKPGTGIVQSFHAKNIPSDRLTLRPRDKLGIFNKGRASSPVKGRGLPDLVFSEMRFLQKHKDQPEVIPQTGLSKKRLRKDEAHAREEEISAYFTTVRPALAEQDVNIQAKEGFEEKDPTQELDPEKHRPAEVDNTIPTIEMPDEAPYLGFGNRGLRHESGSYISWSESIRAPSVTPMIPRIKTAINVDRLDTDHGIRERRATKGGDMSHPRAAPHQVTRHATDGSSGRFSKYTRVPRNHRISRSHSLPEHTSSPRHRNLVNRVHKSRTAETAASLSSIPPSLPHRAVPIEQRRRHTHVDSASHSSTLLDPPEESKPIHPKKDIVDTDADYKETDNNDPPTSSSLGKILQDCNTTFNERRRTAASYESNNFPIAPPPRPLMQRGVSNLESHGAPQTVLTVRFAGVDSYRPVLPSFCGPGIYEIQEQRQQYMQQPDLENYAFIQEPDVGEMDGLMDNDFLEWTVALPDETRSYQFTPAVLEESLAGLYEMEHEEQRLDQSDNVVASGFWRPHKLY